MTELRPGQQAFMEMADQAGVDTSLFGPHKPEIQFQEENPDPTKPTIAYFHTGGTLAMAESEQNEGALSFENAVDLSKIIEVCNFIAGVRKRYNILGVNIASLDSKEVFPEAWTAMAAAVKTVYDRVEGVTIGHGTHTVEHSASGLSYALRKLAFPVVFTASQIPSVGYPGSDGIPNLTGAMEIAANGDFAEVLAYAHGEIHRGTRFSKANDSRLNVFESRVTGPIGYLGGAGIEVLHGARRRSGTRKHELIFQPKFDKSVPTIKVNPSITDQTLRQILSGTTESVAAILETYGSGAIPNSYVPVLEERLKAGMPVYLTSSAGQSGISDGMQNHDDDAIRVHEAGIRNARDMTTTAATAKLMNIMMQDEIPSEPQARMEYVEQEMIEKNYAGEVTIQQSGADF